MNATRPASTPSSQSRKLRRAPASSACTACSVCSSSEKRDTSPAVQVGFRCEGERSSGRQLRTRFESARPTQTAGSWRAAPQQATDLEQRVDLALRRGARLQRRFKGGFGGAQSRPRRAELCVARRHRLRKPLQLLRAGDAVQVHLGASHSRGERLLADGCGAPQRSSHAHRRAGRPLAAGKLLTERTAISEATRFVDGRVMWRLTTYDDESNNHGRGRREQDAPSLITGGSHRLPVQTTARGFAAASARRGPRTTTALRRAQAARVQAEAAACVSGPSSIEAQGRTWSARSRAAWRAASRSRSRVCAAAKPAARSSWLASRAGSSCVATMSYNCASARQSCGAPAASSSAQALTS